MKVISMVNFVRGGKSSIARLLAENLGTSILNFDPKRNAEAYNAIKTTNILENSKVTRTKNTLEIDTEEETMIISSKSDYIICDFGGRFDERINEFKSDIYILPTMDDFESISETIRATKYILKNNPTANILHILNMAMSHSKSEREEFEKGYTSLMSTNLLSHINYMIMPKSKLVKNLINEKQKMSDVIGKSKFLALGAYKNINNFVKDLTKVIQSNTGVDNEK